MRYKFLIYSVVIVLSVTLFSCAPLRNVHKTEQKEQIIVDNSITELIKTEIKKQISSINQTTIEFYPPKTVYTVDTVSTLYTENNSSKPKMEQKPKESVVTVDSIHTNIPKKPPDISVNQPIKSITTTQINTKTDKITKKDSIILSDIVHTIDTDYTEKTEDKPFNFVSSIKWIAIVLAIILLTILILKFR